MRLCGIFPAFFGYFLGTMLYTQIKAPWEVRFLIAIPFITAAVFLSPSDYLAIFFPRRFQKEASEADVISHGDALRILLEEVRNRMD